MAQAQIAEQKILQALFEQLKKEIADGEGLAWLFQQKAYTDGDNKPTKETPPLRTTSEDLRRDYWSKLSCDECGEEYWFLTTFYCRKCRWCKHNKVRHTKKGCGQCTAESSKETSA
ncbi:NS2 [Gray fox amdovirus]|uniref:NS2 n=1 Tax=Gray fox amdovirus TaxID=1093101 RepID=G5CKI3_9VIRU|nr:NS2 [Gray fox amdovirus]AEP95279.1 NS2 [Gray fox amdovirus]